MKEYFNNEKKEFGTIQILDSNKLKQWVKDVSIFLDENLEVIISDHVKISFEIDELRKQKINYYNAVREEEKFKEEVNVFWDEKDYLNIVTLIEKYNGCVDGSLKKNTKLPYKD